MEASFASEPVFLDWDSFVGKTEQVEIAAKLKDDRTIDHMKISTESGSFELSAKAREKIWKPKLNTITVISFPLSIDASETEYHIQFYYRSKSYSRRRSDCWDKDGQLGYDFVRIRVNNTGIRKIDYQKGACEVIDYENSSGEAIFSDPEDAE